MKQFASPLLKIIVLTGVVAGLFVVMGYTESAAKFVHPMIWQVLILQFIVALIVTFYHAYFFSKKEENMVNVFLGSTLIRLTLSITIMVYLLFQTEEKRLVLVIDFFLVYLFYMVFEIMGIISNLRAISRK